MDNNQDQPKSSKRLYIIAGICVLIPILLVITSVNWGGGQNSTPDRLASQQIRDQISKSLMGKCDDGTNTSYCQCIADNLNNTLTLTALGRFTETGAEGAPEGAEAAFISEYAKGCN